MYGAKDTRGREQVSVYQRGPRAAAREPHRAKRGECEVTASLSHVRARQAPGRGSAMRRPSLLAATLSPRVGDGRPPMWPTARDGRRGGHHDSRPHGWPAGTLRLGAGSAPVLLCASAGAAARRPPSGHFMASDPRDAPRVRVRRNMGELKRRRRQEILRGAFHPPWNQSMAPYELDLRGRFRCGRVGALAQGGAERNARDCPT